MITLTSSIRFAAVHSRSVLIQKAPATEAVFCFYLIVTDWKQITVALKYSTTTSLIPFQFILIAAEKSKLKCVPRFFKNIIFCTHCGLYGTPNAVPIFTSCTLGIFQILKYPEHMECHLVYSLIPSNFEWMRYLSFSPPFVLQKRSTLATWTTTLWLSRSLDLKNRSKSSEKM